MFARLTSLLVVASAACGGSTTSVLVQVSSDGARPIAALDFTIERNGVPRTASAPMPPLPFSLRVLVPDVRADVSATAVARFTDATSTSASGHATVVPFSEARIDLHLDSATSDGPAADLTAPDLQVGTCGADCNPAPTVSVPLGVLVRFGTACPTGYGAAEYYHARLQADCSATSCACSSGSMACNASIHFFTNATCAVATSSVIPMPSSCTAATGTTAAEFGISAALSACTPSGTAGAPPPRWLDDYVFCPLPGASSLGCAGSDVCLPGSSAFPAQCYADTTGSGCSSSYRLMLPVYTGFDDRRNCTCGCGPPQVNPCTPISIDVFTGTSCASTPAASYTSDQTTCQVVPSGVNWVKAGGTSSPARCTPTATSTSGANPTGLVTFCCRGVLP